jgi:hypothetical protein
MQAARGSRKRAKVRNADKSTQLIEIQGTNRDMPLLMFRKTEVYRQYIQLYQSFNVTDNLPCLYRRPHETDDLY